MSGDRVLFKVESEKLGELYDFIYAVAEGRDVIGDHKTFADWCQYHAYALVKKWGIHAEGEG